MKILHWAIIILFILFIFLYYYETSENKENFIISSETNKTSEYEWDENKAKCKESNPASCIKKNNYCVDLVSKVCPLDENADPKFNEENCEYSGNFVWCGIKKSGSCNIEDCSGNGTASGSRPNCNCICNPGYSGTNCGIKASQDMFTNKGINCDDVSADNPPDMVWLNNQKWFSENNIPGQNDNKINYVRTVHYRNSYDFNPLSNLFINKDPDSYWSPPKYSREWVEFLLRNNIKVSIGITVTPIDVEIWETKWQLNQLVNDIKRWSSEPEQINKNIICINIGNEPAHQESWKTVLHGLEYAQNLKKSEPLLKNIPISYVENWYELFDNIVLWMQEGTKMIDYKFKENALKSFELIDTLSLNIYPYYSCVTAQYVSEYKCTRDNIFDHILYNSSGDIDKNYQLYSPIYALITLKYHIKELMKIPNSRIKIDLDKTNIAETGWPYQEDGFEFIQPMVNKEIYKRVYDDIISFNKEEMSMNIDGVQYTDKTPYVIHFFTINDATDYDKKSNTIIQQHFGANVLLSDSDKKLLDNNKKLIEKINKLSRSSDGINTEIYNNKSLQDQLKNTNKALKCYQDNIMDLQYNANRGGSKAPTVKTMIDALSMCPQVNYSSANDVTSSVCNIRNHKATGDGDGGNIKNNIYNYEYDTSSDIYKRKTGQFSKQDGNLKWLENKITDIDYYYGSDNMSTKNEYLCNNLDMDVSLLNKCNNINEKCYTTDVNKINSIISDGKNNKIYEGTCKFKSDTCGYLPNESDCNGHDNCEWNSTNMTCNQIKNKCKGNIIKNCTDAHKDYICNNSYANNNGVITQCEFKKRPDGTHLCESSDKPCIVNKEFIDTDNYILLKSDNIYRLSEKNEEYDDLKEIDTNKSVIKFNENILIDKNEYIAKDLLIELDGNYHIKMQTLQSTIDYDNVKLNDKNNNYVNPWGAFLSKDYIWIIYYSSKIKVDKCSEQSISECNNSYKLKSINSENDIKEILNIDGDYKYNCLVNYDNNQEICVPNSKNINMYNHNICPSYTQYLPMYLDAEDVELCAAAEPISGYSRLNEDNCQDFYTKVDSQFYNCKWKSHPHTGTKACLVSKDIEGKCNNLDNPSITKFGQLYCDITPPSCNNIKGAASGAYYSEERGGCACPAGWMGKNCEKVVATGVDGAVDTSKLSASEIAQVNGDRCSADFGSSTPCCGQPGDNIGPQYDPNRPGIYGQCPSNIPICTNYQAGVRWGECN